MPTKQSAHASSLARHWALDPQLIFLNHGSFGACPRKVLGAQRKWLTEMEASPVDFLARRLPGLLEEVRRELGRFLDAPADDLALVPNATTAVNAVLRSLDFRPGDEILFTDHVYNACRNAVRYVAQRSRAKVVEVKIPLPIRSPDQIVDAILDRITPRTRLAMLDHVTSPTALTFPIERLVKELNRRGVDTLVDGAHAPGMVPLHLAKLKAAYYTGNCHKWLCAPKGAAFLYVRTDRQKLIHPLTISHGLTAPTGRFSRFQLEFSWTGTADPTAYLAIPDAIRFMGRLLPGGWRALMKHNHDLALQAQKILCDRLGLEPICPDEMLGAMAAIPLPGRIDAEKLSLTLFRRHKIEVPLMAWPGNPCCFVRISAQAYNSPRQYEILADVLCKLLGSKRFAACC